MTTPPQEQSYSVSCLKERLQQFLEVLDEINPESTDIDEVDRLIAMIDELESKCIELKGNGIEN